MQHISKSFELIIGLAGGEGTNFKFINKILELEFKKAHCTVVTISVDELDKDVPKGMRAYAVVEQIFQSRLDLLQQGHHRIVYIVNSLSYIEEYQIFRQIYHKNFILLSIYECPRSRIGNLGIKMRELEDKSFGVDIKDIYHKAHYFLHFEHLKEDVERFISLYFNAPFITPTKDEICMMHAYVASLRSSAISRQVGAVICDDDGNVLSSGCNEVPKFGGGLAWEDTFPDLRDFKTVDAEGLTLSQHYKSKYMKDSLEFFRTVDAEEASICDAARRGISIHKANLYSTTFPCHLCTKSIIAAGIKRVVYIEAYPKSLSENLFSGLVKDNALKQDNHVVKYAPFRGVAPKRYKYLFKKSKMDRKDNEKLIQWNLKDSQPKHLSNFNPLSYFWVEYYHIQEFYKSTNKPATMSVESAMRLFETLYPFF